MSPEHLRRAPKILTNNCFSSLTFGFIFGLSSLIVAKSSQAALINLSSWNLAGDVEITSLGQVDLSTNALQNDDSPIAFFSRLRYKSYGF